MRSDRLKLLGKNLLLTSKRNFLTIIIFYSLSKDKGTERHCEPCRWRDVLKKIILITWAPRRAGCIQPLSDTHAKIFEAINPAEVAIAVGKGVSWVDHCGRGVNGPPLEWCRDTCMPSPSSDAHLLGHLSKWELKSCFLISQMRGL